MAEQINNNEKITMNNLTKYFESQKQLQLKHKESSLNISDDCIDVTPPIPMVVVDDDDYCDDIVIDVSQDDEYYLNSLTNIKNIKEEKQDDLNNTYYDKVMKNMSLIMYIFTLNEINNTKFKVRNDGKFKDRYLNIPVENKFPWPAFVNLAKTFVSTSSEKITSKNLQVIKTLPTKYNINQVNSLPGIIEDEYEITVVPQKQLIEAVWNKLEEAGIRKYRRHVQLLSYKEKTYRFRMTKHKSQSNAVFDLKHCAFGYEVAINDEYITDVDVKYAKEMKVIATRSANIKYETFDKNIQREYIFIDCVPILNPYVTYNLRLSRECKRKIANNINSNGKSKLFKPHPPNKPIKYEYKLEFEIKQNGLNKINEDLTFSTVYDITKDLLQSFLFERTADGTKGTFGYTNYTFTYNLDGYNDDNDSNNADTTSPILTNNKIKLSNILRLYEYNEKKNIKNKDIVEN